MPKSKKTITKQIGNCAVDSGQIILTDPCYIDSEWEQIDFSENIFDPKYHSQFNYAGCSQATIDETKGGQLYFIKGHAGAGVTVSSGFGDGCYPVIAKLKNYGTEKKPDWRVKEAVIKFIED